MDEVTTDMSNEPAKRSPKIKLMRLFFPGKGVELDISISPDIASYFDFCLWLRQHSWESVLDEIRILSSPAKVLNNLSSLMKYPKDSAPRTPKRQTINYRKETDGSKSDNFRQPNDNVSENLTNPSASDAFASPRISKSFKKIEYSKNWILWTTYIFVQPRIVQRYLWDPT